MDVLAADELSVDLLLDEDVLSEDCIVLLDAADAGALMQELVLLILPTSRQ